MSNPSLLCVPYRFKTSKLYSQIPDSGLGDFTVTRSASNAATRINAAGLIETVADNVPRLDYPLGGIKAGCPALLIEPSAQNITLNSEVISGTLTGASIDANVAVSPDGTTTADKLKEDSNPGTHTLGNIVGGSLGGTVDSSPYRISIFAKADGRTQFLFFDNNQTGAGAGQSTFNLSSGTATGTGVIQNYGNGWYRCIISCAKTALTSANAQVRLLDAGGNQSYTGNGTSGILFWGKQLEVGSVATSYIPTTASPVTRGAETISKTGVSSLIGQTEGTIYAEVDLRNKGVSVSRVIYLSDGTSDNEIRISHSVTTAGDLQIAIRLAGSLVVNKISPTAVYFGINKIAVGYKVGTNEVAMYVNGSQIILSTSSGNMPACNTIHLGSQLGTSNFLNDRIRAIELYPTRLPNTGPLSLQSLTQ